MRSEKSGLAMFEANARYGKLIDMRRALFIRAVAAEPILADVIAQDEEEVGAALGGLGDHGEHQCERQADNKSWLWSHGASMIFNASSRLAAAETPARGIGRGGAD